MIYVYIIYVYDNPSSSSDPSLSYCIIQSVCFPLRPLPLLLYNPISVLPPQTPPSPTV